jgi:ribosomal protein L19E
VLHALQVPEQVSVLLLFIVSILLLCLFRATGQNIRKLVKDGFVIRKPTTIHSRARARRQAEAKAKGRHTGYGKQGTQAGTRSRRLVHYWK